MINITIKNFSGKTKKELETFLKQEYEKAEPPENEIFSETKFVDVSKLQLTDEILKKVLDDKKKYGDDLKDFQYKLKIVIDERPTSIVILESLYEGDKDYDDEETYYDFEPEKAIELLVANINETEDIDGDIITTF